MPAIVADILTARGITPVEAEDFFQTDHEPEDPFLLPDMAQAVARLEKALAEGERITIYGDYDCDGVTATVILYQYLQSMGANVDWYIPERLDEGYGLNRTALEEIQARGTTLVVTVDNGISALEEVAYAGELGMEVVITDHHQVGKELPGAVAVVNPHRSDYGGSFRNLCGAGVAFKLIAAMEGGYEMALEEFGAVAAIGTIGDIVPLTGENRWLVCKGLELMEYPSNAGLQALLETAGMAGKPVTSQKVAFGLSPRINAAGRMGSAKLAVQLLLSENAEEAADLAEELNHKNLSRQAEEEAILKQVQEAIGRNPELLLNRVLVVAAEGLNHGVVGIVSAKLITLYGKPNIILSIDGDTAVGSARSVEGFSLFKALSACSDILVKYGGHSMAAGLTLRTSDIAVFTKRINAYAAEFHDQMPVVCQKIDRELHAADITLQNISCLQQLEPFGEHCPQPLFLLRNCRIEEIIPMSENRHLKLKVQFEGKSIYVLYFKMSTDQFIYPIGSVVDILANLELNTFRDSVSVAIRLKDIRPSGFQDSKFHNAHHYYEKLRRNEAVESRIVEISVPTITELRWLYKLLRSRGGAAVHLDLFYLSAVSGTMNYCKYRIILDVFCEMKLISIPADLSSIKLLETGKVDLEKSVILRRLQNMQQHAERGNEYGKHI
ncbi:MAG: single-stranded-DNA-specific exonuclease RecJ [Candidatus Merdivicinus sp.]